MSDSKQKFDTVGYVELLKCALEGEMTYVTLTEEGEKEEWGFEHIGDREALVEAIKEDEALQSRLERLIDDE